MAGSSAFKSSRPNTRHINLFFDQTGFPVAVFFP
jgi:hypothetical protein